MKISNESFVPRTEQTWNYLLNVPIFTSVKYENGVDNVVPLIKFFVGWNV